MKLFIVPSLDQETQKKSEIDENQLISITHVLSEEDEDYASWKEHEGPLQFPGEITHLGKDYELPKYDLFYYSMDNGVGCILRGHLNKGVIKID